MFKIELVVELFLHQFLLQLLIRSQHPKGGTKERPYTITASQKERKELSDETLSRHSIVGLLIESQYFRKEGGVVVAVVFFFCAVSGMSRALIQPPPSK